MFAVPGLIPVTTPVVELIVAVTVLDDDHVPPGVMLESVVYAPVHMVAAPVIGPGVGLTVSDIVL
jgi:hypothetical protein